MDFEKRESFEESFKKTDFYKMNLVACFAFINGRYIWDEVQAAWETYQAAIAIPEGFVLFPKEPTQEIYRTFYDAFNSANSGNTAQCFKVAYKAMIEGLEQNHE